MMTFMQKATLGFLLLMYIQRDNAVVTSSKGKVLSSIHSWSQYRTCMKLQILHHRKDVDAYQRRDPPCASYIMQSFTSSMGSIKNINNGNPVKGYSVKIASFSSRHHDQPKKNRLHPGIAKINGRGKLHLHKDNPLDVPRHLKMEVTPVSSTPTKEGIENWTCVCEPGGLLGFQQFNTLVSQRFEECQCPSGCQLCPAGQVLNPFVYANSSCSCVSPFLLVVRLIELSLDNYTIQMEESLRSSIALLLQMPSLQIMPFARREGSVIVDSYIFSSAGATLSEVETRSITKFIQQSNQTAGGVLKDPVLGQYTILAYQNPLENHSLGKPSSWTQNKFLFPLVILSIIIGVLVLLISTTCIVFYMKKKQYPVFSKWFIKEEKRQSLTSLMSKSSRSTEGFHIYDNSCFHMTTGCMGKQFLRHVERPDHVLGVVTQRFLYSELHDATGGFCDSNVIGVGGSCMVFYGKLKDGRLVAIKRLNFLNGPEIEQEFLLEVELLSRLHHIHLVSLLGYCYEIHGKKVQRILVYGFMENGNLREHLRKVGSKALNWITRLQIALGAARGLEYLHEAADPRVLHRDFKSQNILLDYKWRAKVADFGMAKVIESRDFDGCTNSPAQMFGTFGYLAPEYATTGKATTKSDVFSYGVVLLELISGRQSLNISSPQGEQSLIQWALPLLHDREWVVNNLVDPELRHYYLPESVHEVALMAWACLQADPELRPSMTSVVQTLSSTLVSRPTEDDGPGLCMSNIQALGKVYGSRYTDQDQQDRSDISPERFNVQATYPYVSLDKGTDQKAVDALNMDKDPSSQHEWKKTLLLKRTSSLSAAESLLGLGSVLSPSNSVRRCFEEEALDLVKPRLEYFWHHGEPMERL